jgi:hypothetical protein
MSETGDSPFSIDLVGSHCYCVGEVEGIEEGTQVVETNVQSIMVFRVLAREGFVLIEDYISGGNDLIGMWIPNSVNVRGVVAH